MSFTKKRIFVTGVAGFLGSHLAEKLVKLGHEVIGMDNMIGGYEDNVPKNIKFHKGDCCDFEKVQAVMRDVDVVYHCAATAHEGLSVFSPFEITKNNYLASVAIFSAAVNQKVKRIIFCSSMARYGGQQTPFSEEMKPAPVDPYAISKVALILGDNFFYGQSLTHKLKSCIKLNSGCKILVHPVNKPELYGVAEVNAKNKITSIKEKPKKSKSNLAVTGLYFFDNQVIKYSKSLKPSKRKELEIVDLLNKYRKSNKLSAELLGRGGAWF